MPLQRFNGFLRGMVPVDNHGGLLSAQDQRAAGQAARAQFASGLLAAAGPQRMPVSLGQAIGGALPQAMQARDQRAEAGLRNDQLRRQIERENKETAASAKLGGFFRGLGPEGEMLAMLNDVSPSLAMQGMGLLASQQGQEQQRDPADLQMMDALGLPRTPEGLAQLNAAKSDATMKPMMDALNLQIQSLQLANMQRTAEQEQQAARETRLTRENAIKNGLEQTFKIADLNQKLEGTALAAGLPASDWRRSGVGVFSAVGGALGLDMDKTNADLAAFDTMKKNLNDQLITLMSSGELGTGTNEKLQQYRASLGSPDIQPKALMEIQAGIGQLFLEQADILGIEIPNRDQAETRIEAMRNYQPGGSETLIDAPAAAAAVGKAVVRAADIARMSLEKLQAIDPANLDTPELLEAAAKRWDELNAR